MCLFIMIGFLWFIKFLCFVAGFCTRWMVNDMFVFCGQYLDEVVLEIETCDTPRPPNSPAHVASYRSGGKYGFVDRVIDGMYVHINSVVVKFISRKFHASLQVLQSDAVFSLYLEINCLFCIYYEASIL